MSSTHKDLGMFSHSHNGISLHSRNKWQASLFQTHGTSLELKLKLILHN